MSTLNSHEILNKEVRISHFSSTCLFTLSKYLYSQGSSHKLLFGTFSETSSCSVHYSTKRLYFVFIIPQEKFPIKIYGKN